jgi:hypothetical protein
MGTNTSKDSADESLRGPNIKGSDQTSAADHLQHEKRRNRDKTLRESGEEDTLYDDGLEVDKDSAPLTGVNGVDDSR